MKRPFLTLVSIFLWLVLVLAACNPAVTPTQEAVTSPTEPTQVAVATQPEPTEVPRVQEPAAAPAKVRILHQFNDAENAKFEEIVSNFEAENPDIDLILERNNDTGYYDSLITQFMGNAAPDIVRVEPPRAAQFIGAGYAANIDAVISPDLRDTFFPATLEPLTKDGALYGVPQDVATMVLFYRTDMFEAAGLSGPPTTWEELVEDAKALTQPPDVYGIGLFGGWGAWEFYPWLWQAGAEVLEQQNGKWVPAFNSPEGVDALQFWVDLIYEHRVMPEGSATYTEDDVKAGFIAEKIAMFTSGAWSVSSLKEVKEIEGKWDIAPYPKGKEEASVLGGMDWLISEQSQHQEEAARFLNYLLQDEIQLDWAKSLGYLPIKRNLYNDPLFKNDPFMAAYADALEVARQRPTIPQAGEIDGFLSEALQAAMSGALTSQEALDQAAARTAEILK